MSKQAAVIEAKPGLHTRVVDFYHDVMNEMSKVTWPSKEELKMNTSVVLILLVIMASVIYFYDVIFQVIVIGLLNQLT